MDYKSGSLCLVVRDDKILTVKHKRNDKQYYTLPGGGIEDGERPEEAAVRELSEECNVSGKIIKKLNEYHFPFGNDVIIHTFYMDIGDQAPSLGKDPELPDDEQILAELKWMALDEMSERDRAFLFAQGLLGIEQFFGEVSSWNDDISYPGKRT